MTAMDTAVNLFWFAFPIFGIFRLAFIRLALPTVDTCTIDWKLRTPALRPVILRRAGWAALFAMYALVIPIRRSTTLTPLFALFPWHNRTRLLLG